ncbi:MAG: hypothetical protein L7F77_04565 [Candidatus Magnetominusculus sp. LBB02]|nr:hypothetical protein [Candidatus Magnetominusculus sp. LBB02]
MSEEQAGFIEKLMDNPIGLLVLSNGVLLVVYFLWGLFEIETIAPIPDALKAIILGGK